MEQPSHDIIVTAQSLLGQVEQIAKLYQDQFFASNDLKALQGMERCVELQMKICGFDGKQSPDPLLAANNSISLGDLPSELLEKLVNHIKTEKMQQLQ